MAEIYWQILLITLIQQTISVFGIVFNLAIVWITVKNKNLQNSFGYFLAIYSFCEAVLESSTFLPTILVLIRTKISISTCFYASVIQTLWSTLNIAFNLLFISVDRFFAISFPIFYCFVIKRGAGKYVIMMNLLSSAYIFAVIYNLFILENRDSTVYCEPGDLVGVKMANWITYNVIILLTLTLLVYVVVGLVLMKYNHGTGNNGNVQQTRRIYKSILVIMGVIFLLYFMGTFGGQFIVPLLTRDSEMAFLYTRLFVQLITLAGAINAPVLYCLSMEYRNVLDRHFPFIRTFLVFCHIQKNANNVIVLLPAMGKSTNLPSNNVVQVQAK